MRPRSASWGLSDSGGRHGLLQPLCDPPQRGGLPQAARFDPGRWRTARPTVYEYLPFGAGPHHCVGRHFALLEITIVLSMLLQRHRLSLVPGTRIDRANRMALVPRDGMPMRVLSPSSAAPAPHVRGDIRTSIDLS
ncbi:cytochrome P450 [Nocardiopsis composta]